MVMFHFIKSIISDISWSLESTHKSCMSSLLTVATLEHVWVYICFTYCCNITFYIKELVNKHFSWITALHIPNVYPDNSHIRSREKFNNLWFKCNLNVKNVSGFDDCSYNASIDWSVCTFNKIWNTKNLEVRFGLW